MIFKDNSPLYGEEVETKSGESVLYVNYLKASFVPSIADSEEDMARVIKLLTENPDVSRVVFVQQRNYSYPSEQTLLLSEVANFINYLVKQENLLSMSKLSYYGDPAQVYQEITYFLDSIKRDPLRAYLEISSFRSRLLSSYQSEGFNSQGVEAYSRLLSSILSSFSKLKLITLFHQKKNTTYSGREFYKSIFRADVLPNFTFTRLMARLPENAELIDQYSVESNFEKFNISIFKQREDAKYFYHIMPSEYELSEEKHLLVNLARNVLSEHRPKAEEFTDPAKTRQVFFNVAKDLLSELANNKRISLDQSELNKLSKILVRHTVGFGLIEVLMADSKLQDIVLNAPISLNPIYVRHEVYDECRTNIIPSFEDADSWAAKLRLQSGRPLDEANPILDTEIVLEDSRARVAAVKEPLSPNGLAYAFRRHRDNPWTLPLFVKNGMINSFAAGLLSFLIDGNRTMLVAGTRSSGKTSLLGSLMLEILTKYRVIVVEDTLELPVDALRKVGYDILRMKVRSALVSGSSEIEAAEGIRTSLRLGDSALIIGEVRSAEAKALYEAMRVGALANVVAGTIHGDSPYGVYDRVVNDLGVERTSFKATDIIVISNPIKTADGLHSKRKVLSVTEVRKHWNGDPLEEGGFVDLLRYNVDTEQLEPTEELINGDSEVIKSIVSNVKGWAGNWDAVYDNIILRGKVKQEIVEASIKLNKPVLLEAEFNSICNVIFHELSAKVREEHGLPYSDKVFPEFKKWLYSAAERY